MNKKQKLFTKTSFILFCAMQSMLYEVNAVKFSINQFEKSQIIRKSHTTKTESVIRTENQHSRVIRQLEKIRNLDEGKERKKVVIIGAGMSGLSAAYELKNLGHTVSIIEATNRVGGRVWTHKFQSTGEYHELGAMRIPASHDFTRHYIEVVGLKESLRPFITSHQNPNAFYYLRGKVARIKDAPTEILPEYNLSAHEKKIATKAVAPAIFGIHLENALRSLNHKFPNHKEDEFLEDDYWQGIFSESFLSSHGKKLEGSSLGEFLREHLESEDARELIGATTGLEVMWDKAVTMFLRDEVAKTGEGLEEIAGGLSRLPNGLADVLGRNLIRFNTEVLSIESSSHGVKLKTRPTNPKLWDSPPTLESSSDELADYVICTIPFGVLRRMEIKGLSAHKMRAIRNLEYASSTKVLLNFTKRFWEMGPPDEKIIGGASLSDQITRSTYYPSDHAIVSKQKKDDFKGLFTVSKPLSISINMKILADEPGPGVMVGSYNWGRDAQRLGALSPEERAEAVLEVLEKFHPEIRKHLHPKERAASMFWDTYRWSRGAFCFMRPHDLKDHYHATVRPEGRLYFAGEHCSLDQGWIQGAVKSGVQAVEDVVSQK